MAGFTGVVSHELLPSMYYVFNTKFSGGPAPAALFHMELTPTYDPKRLMGYIEFL